MQSRALAAVVENPSFSVKSESGGERAGRVSAAGRKLRREVAGALHFALETVVGPLNSTRATSTSAPCTVANAVHAY